MKTIIFKIVISIIILPILLILVSMLIYSPQYMYRILCYGESDIADHLVFENRKIPQSKNPETYETGGDGEMGELMIKVNNDTLSLNKLIEETNTTSFIIIKDDKLIFEKYGPELERSSLATSFSSVKSIVSLMIGIAIDEGYIKNVDQSLSELISEFENSPVGEVSLKELLSMRSPIKYSEGGLWFGDDAKTYYLPDLRELALNGVKLDSAYNGNFHYNNYHPLMLGLVLERATGMKVADYFSTRIWDKIGAEYDASWSIDSHHSGFEKMESGLNFRPIDYAKIGSMMLNNGKWAGNKLVSQAWIEDSTIADFPIDDADYDGSFLENKKTGYKFMWYSQENKLGGIDYYAFGKYGQLIYISPVSNIVIVRTGSDEGGIHWWPHLINEIIEVAGR